MSYTSISDEEERIARAIRMLLVGYPALLPSVTARGTLCPASSLSEKKSWDTDLQDKHRFFDNFCLKSVFLCENLCPNQKETDLSDSLLVAGFKPATVSRMLCVLVPLW